MNLKQFMISGIISLLSRSKPCLIVAAHSITVSSISDVGSGTDYERFYQALGVPSSGMGFQVNHHSLPL